MFLVKTPNAYGTINGYSDFAAGIICGIGCLAAGYALGQIGNSGIRAFRKTDKMFTIMILLLVFTEALAIFALITSLRLSFTKYGQYCIPWKFETLNK